MNHECMLHHGLCFCFCHLCCQKLARVLDRRGVSFSTWNTWLWCRQRVLLFNRLGVLFITCSNWTCKIMVLAAAVAVVKKRSWVSWGIFKKADSNNQVASKPFQVVGGFSMTKPGIITRKPQIQPREQQLSQQLGGLGNIGKAKEKEQTNWDSKGRCMWLNTPLPHLHLDKIEKNWQLLSLSCMGWSWGRWSLLRPHHLDVGIGLCLLFPEIPPCFSKVFPMRITWGVLFVCHSVSKCF